MCDDRQVEDTVTLCNVTLIWDGEKRTCDGKRRHHAGDHMEKNGTTFPIRDWMIRNFVFKGP